jgi:tryptophan 2,3-dioxygenase
MDERLDTRLPDEERATVHARYEQEMASAERWLHPDDAHRRRVRAAILFIESYRSLPMLALPREILDRFVEMEQALLIFRQRHARMVERIIGRRVGTGGTSGVRYLDETAIAYRVFEDLWQARTFLLPSADLPPLEDATFYDF